VPARRLPAVAFPPSPSLPLPSLPLPSCRYSASSRTSTGGGSGAGPAPAWQPARPLLPLPVSPVREADGLLLCRTAGVRPGRSFLTALSNGSLSNGSLSNGSLSNGSLERLSQTALSNGSLERLSPQDFDRGSFRGVTARGGAASAAAGRGAGGGDFVAAGCTVACLHSMAPVWDSPVQVRKRGAGWSRVQGGGRAWRGVTRV
jgi:hypothetical protein